MEPVAHTSGEPPSTPLDDDIAFQARYLQRVTIPLERATAALLIRVARAAFRTPKAQAEWLLHEALHRENPGDPTGPYLATGGLAWDDDRASHANGATVAIHLPGPLARALQQAALRDDRTLRQEALHLLSRQLEAEAEP